MRYIDKVCEQCMQTYSCMYKKRNINKFCSPECAQQARIKRVSITCATCGKERLMKPGKMNSTSGLYFCSRSCKNIAQRYESGVLVSKNTKYGHASYRQRAFNGLPAECSCCGYCEDVRMLDVDHIDGNRKNNMLINLQILCVWCHALKTRKVR